MQGSYDRKRKKLKGGRGQWQRAQSGGLGRRWRWVRALNALPELEFFIFFSPFCFLQLFLWKLWDWKTAHQIKKKRGNNLCQGFLFLKNSAVPTFFRLPIWYWYFSFEYQPIPMTAHSGWYTLFMTYWVWVRAAVTHSDRWKCWSRTWQPYLKRLHLNLKLETKKVVCCVVINFSSWTIAGLH